ncbi:hypothetical protein NDU88_002649 [Pleurodeles waltl]|uniref:Uncharacterized protein n=1 Tax=Pleurodeles waltl TaxID=8319 RepID=A0AAV7LEC5_PLEWA|nr:hypothetical protein NDU88_002649 [Pleurodeles waltl]
MTSTKHKQDGIIKELLQSSTTKHKEDGVKVPKLQSNECLDRSNNLSSLNELIKTFMAQKLEGLMAEISLVRMDLKPSLSDVHKDIDDLSQREYSLKSAQDERCLDLKAYSTFLIDLQDQVIQMQEKQEDLEKRSLCFNLRVKGIPPGTEGEHRRNTFKTLRTCC